MTTETEKPKTLKVTLELEIAITDQVTIFVATGKANELLKSAKEIGTASGEVNFGRMRYPL